MCGIFSKPNSLATDLEHVNSLRMKLLGDGRRYIVSLRSKACRDGDFYQTVIKPPSGKWSELTLPIDNFQLTHYGMINTNTVLMDTREVITFGLTIQDSVEGPFSLKSAETSQTSSLHLIGLCHLCTERVALSRSESKF